MKGFKRGKKGFTLVELLIVIAILGVLAAVVIPNVIGLMGRGGAQAYETDEEVIQLATSTFYADVHSGWNDVDNNDPTAYTDNVWGANGTTEDPGHYYPTAIAVTGSHILRLSTTVYDTDNVNNYRITKADGTTAATDTDIANHAIWMGLLVHAPGDFDSTDGVTARADVSVLATENGLYLQEIPKSAMPGDTTRNGGVAGSYCWVVGKNGTVYGAYAPTGGTPWYSGFQGSYP